MILNISTFSVISLNLKFNVTFTKKGRLYGTCVFRSIVCCTNMPVDIGHSIYIITPILFSLYEGTYNDAVLITDHYQSTHASHSP